MNIPFNDLSIMNETLRCEIDAAIKRVIDSSMYILGPEVEKFENEFARYVGVRHAIGTSNGTTALIVALKAIGIAAGDEVLVPAMTFFASAEAPALLGARPVFVDIDPATHNIAPNSIRDKITPKTRVIMPVHLHGQPADLDSIRGIASDYGLTVLSDCAHAAGAKYKGKRIGGIEDIAAFSFYPSKNLGALGEAGMVVTNDDRLAEQCRRFRNHGSLKRFEHTAVGLNARLEPMQAAVLSVKLPHLDEWNSERRAIARMYNSLLSGMAVELPKVVDGVEHVYHIYQIRLDHRDAIVEKMTRAGIGVNIHYPVPMHLHEGFSYLHCTPGMFPIAETFARRTLSLPCYPGLTAEQQNIIVQHLMRFIEGA